MRLRRLRVEQLRLIEAAELDLGPGLNWLSGANGSGKSSLLEGISLLASGRSFRGGSVDSCVRRGSDALTVYAELDSGAVGARRIGLRRMLRGGFDARIDGAAVDALSELFRAFPAVVFPADTGELISGPGEVRRRFMDWGLFHVEQDFFAVWRRFSRALRQRNLVLRTRQPAAVEQAWREELVSHAGELHRMRAAYIDSLSPLVAQVASWLMPGLGPTRLSYRPGWPVDRETLTDALTRSLDTDRRQGFTGLGPQRSGWSLSFEQLPQREMFSRGQAKLASLLMLLAQVDQFAIARGVPPIVGLDDALAELDPGNQQRLVDYLGQRSIQAVLASADGEAVRRLAGSTSVVFHVEQGSVRGPL